ncbi:M23 family metallopeptidase [Almyronema epifaneia]|uniref:M23 family metallopeptidase n=1 Tax=Almyronema epifaneia S1 TaxID=2991925 RepID=A0ABW6IDD0_9CYAN
MPSKPSPKPDFPIRRATLLMLRGFCLIGGFGLLSSGWVMAESLPNEQPLEELSTKAADLTLTVSSDPAPAPAPAAPLSLAQAAELKIETAPTAEVAPSAPAVAAPATESVPAVEAPTVTPPSEVVPATLPATDEVPPGYNSVFVDPTEYSVGATESPTLVFSERSTGCQATLQQGQSVPNTVCGGVSGGNSNTLPALPTNGGEQRVAEAGVGGTPSVNVGPVNISANGINFSGGSTAAGRDYYNRLLRPLNSLRQGVQNYIFPLAVPAPITSLFGWRVHPIYGTQRFHSGTDLGAPLGTPVIAAQAGRVVTADFLGGYGLTVILRHKEGTEETLYGHMSRLLVQPGDWVEQGEVVGLVGSTGNSTGPHLHFEVRQLTGDGWVAMSPNELLGYALANFNQTLNGPIASLILGGDAEATPAIKPAVTTPDLPFRPAQPNAS